MRSIGAGCDDSGTMRGGRVDRTTRMAITPREDDDGDHLSLQRERERERKCTRICVFAMLEVKKRGGYK